MCLACDMSTRKVTGDYMTPKQTGMPSPQKVLLSMMIFLIIVSLSIGYYCYKFTAILKRPVL